MIVEYGINTSGTEWVRRIIERASHLADLGDMLPEPLTTNTQQRWPDQPGVDALQCASTSARGLECRLGGYNEAPSDEERLQLMRMYQALNRCWPDMVGFKTLRFVYWDLIRSCWPDVKFVRMRRDLRGWLNAIARGPRMMFYKVPGYQWLYGERPKHESVIRAEATADAAGVPDSWRVLIRAAYYRDAKYRWWDDHEPEDVLETSFMEIAANWDAEIPRILAHCALPIPDMPTLRTWVGPKLRLWEAGCLSHAIVEEVIALLRERGDCSCD